MIRDEILDEIDALAIALEINQVGRLCYARSCTAHRMTGSLLCTPHWAMLSPEVRRDVIRAYGAWKRRPGETGHSRRLRLAIESARAEVEAAEVQRATRARAERRRALERT